MNEFVKMDVFFIIASTAAILLTVLLVILLIYLIRLIRDAKFIVNKAKVEAELLSEDIRDLRQNVKNGFKIKHLLSFFGSIAKRNKKGH